jgi:acyl carrier protein
VLRAVVERRRARGLSALLLAGDDFMETDPDLGLAVLRQALDRDETSVLVGDLDWTGLAGMANCRLYDELPEIRDARSRMHETDDQTEDPVVALVRSQVAALLGHESSELVELERGFLDMGFDSLTATRLRNRLNEATGLQLPVTLVFDHRTPSALAAHITEQLNCQH